MTTLNTIPEAALDQLFRAARTVHAFQPVPVTDELIHKLYELVKWGPTAFNAQPARYVFVRSEEAKAKLKPALSAGNSAQTLAAGVTVIVAHDTRFYEHLPTQFPAYDAKPIFENSAEAAQATAFRNSSLQGAYLILAARALGLDAGPQSGFNAALVDQAFFPDGRYRTNFLLNLGVADHSGTFQRGPRLAFDEVAQIL
ncbi:MULTISPECIES: malonic semialdehyde reductase [unclassified Variovorax]|uniref:malonic semialdehyde reductase n=1 Tax=unclassified Variovorax TaxID=663243 RepID=UPI0025790471|nr:MULTISPECIES: malonic semialdehyde reductase [unclassified Variovorax]MDM0089151.1 malonic semialdehyde reductase [Variovorax sp. J22G40]MDM0147224.1 malonic semialdehyde reductase [Variovorax sp. J2P1-31]